MSSEEVVAVIGCAARLPGADSVDQFAANLAAGRESVRFYDRAELIAAGIPASLVDDPLYVAAGADLDRLEWFDARFFGMSRLEAEITDPQHRVLLELCWHALEDAAQDPCRFDGAIALYAGLGPPAYLLHHLLRNPQLVDRVSEYQLLLGNDKDFAPSRVAYKLGLGGPAINVNTACSSSLVAVHLAVQALLDYQVDLALAGGVSIQLPQLRGYRYEEGGIGSRDGHCRPFDADASGTVSGNGGGVVVLKRLEDALRDRDPVDALILGSAINNDGDDKVGYTAPSLNGQAAVVSEALAIAGVEAESVSYVETHGTATALGDPIEIAALAQGLARGGDSPLLIGSVKSNIGHLDAAAGVAGLIKTVRMVRDAALYPTLHFIRPNPALALEESAMQVVDRPMDWPETALPRRAGVSSFGIGGTNAHLIIEQPPNRKALRSATVTTLLPLPLSARSLPALRDQAAQLADWLEAAESPPSLADLAWTLASGRRHLRIGCGVVAATSDSAVAALRSMAAGGGIAPHESEEGGTPPGVVFLFSGQGSQWPGMGRELYLAGGPFSEAIDQGLELIEPLIGESLRELLLPQPGEEQRAAERLLDTRIAQPLTLLIELALVRHLAVVGIEPVALAGHSLGEWGAAVVAGVLSAADALRLVVRRAELMARMAPGAMVAVVMSEERLMPLLPEGVSIALYNGPDRLVAAGPEAAVVELEQRLAAVSIEYRRLATSHAFHTAMMEPMLAEWRVALTGVELKPPRLPLLSNSSGGWAGAEMATVDYWVDQLRQPVRFDRNLAQLLARSGEILLEVGPGRALATLARRHQSASPDLPVVTTLGGQSESRSEYEPFHAALIQLWAFGASVDWQAICGAGRQRIHLPGYRFDCERYWIEPAAELAVAATTGTVTTESTMREGGTGFWVPVWQPTAQPMTPPQWQAESGWLVVAASGGAAGRIADRLCARLAATSNEALVVRSDCAEPQQLTTLLAARSPQAGNCSWHLIDLRHLGDQPAELEPVELLHQWMALLRHLLAGGMGWKLGRYDLVVDRTFALADEPLLADRSLLTGPLRVLQQEYPGVVGRVIDLPADLEADAGEWADRLWFELADGVREPRLLLRRSGRYRQRVEPFADLGQSAATSWREGETILITGGYGAVATLVADSLLRRFRSRVVLVGRRSVEGVGRRRERIERLKQIARESGGKLIEEVADVTDRAAVVALLDRLETDGGEIAGVIHAAGVTDAATLLRALGESDRQSESAILAPKVTATRLLCDLLASRSTPPRFLLLLSSTASLLGGPGMASYCAASGWLDSLAQQRLLERSPLRVISSNWDAWPTDSLHGQEADSSDPYQMANGEGEEALIRLVDLCCQSGAPARLIVSGAQLPLRLQRWGGEAHPAMIESSSAAESVEESTSELVKRLWGGLLGVESPPAAADLFALGGDSLLAVQIASRLRDRLGPLVSAADLLEYPRLSDLCRLIEQRQQRLAAISGDVGEDTNEGEMEEGEL